MAEHTPGPWYVVAQNMEVTIEADEEDGPGWEVATIYTDAEGSAYTKADAFLIAAAPDLLNAAEKMVEGEQPCGSPNCAGCDALFALREAIAKAKGEVTDG